jgi:ABC-2 type transport system permease protein
MAANDVFIPPAGKGTWLGFGNLFRKENQRWWKNRRWWIQLLLWAVVLNGMLVAILFVLPNILPQNAEVTGKIDIISTGLQYFFGLSMLGVGVGTVVLTQDEFIQEKQLGTAEWVLSKPASRTSFYLSKLVSNWIAILILLVLVQCLIAFGLFLAAGGDLNPLNFGFGIIIAAVHMTFYLTLTLLVGVIANNRGKVIGIPLGILLGGGLVVDLVKPLFYTSPFGLGKIAISTVAGVPLPGNMYIPVILTVIWSMLFVLLALWRINRMEV